MGNLSMEQQTAGRLYTILGAGGIIANELTKELLSNGKQVRLVSRKAQPTEGVAEVMAADITDPLQTRRAVSGSEIVFLCVGLAYNHKLWQATWPVIMQNVMDACSEAGVPLIFFDNVYMYGLVDGPMTEDTPYNPCSRKGEVRARIATELMDRVRSGSLIASIARAADFYGPGADTTGILNILAINKLKKGKAANWLGNDEVTHSYTFTPDAGKALYLMATDTASYNQVWHLPTTNPAPTGKEFMEMIAQALQVKPRYTKLSGFMVRLAGLFDTTVGEIHEMMYQNYKPYIFDSTKFEKHFNFKPTSYQEGIQRTVRA